MKNTVIILSLLLVFAVLFTSCSESTDVSSGVSADESREESKEESSESSAEESSDEIPAETSSDTSAEYPSVTGDDLRVEGAETDKTLYPYFGKSEYPAFKATREYGPVQLGYSVSRGKLDLYAADMVLNDNGVLTTVGDCIYVTYDYRVFEYDLTAGAVHDGDGYAVDKLGMVYLCLTENDGKLEKHAFFVPENELKLRHIICSASSGASGDGKYLILYLAEDGARVPAMIVDSRGNIRSLPVPDDRLGDVISVGFPEDPAKYAAGYMAVTLRKDGSGTETVLKTLDDTYVLGKRDAADEYYYTAGKFHEVYRYSLSASGCTFGINYKEYAPETIAVPAYHNGIPVTGAHIVDLPQLRELTLPDTLTFLNFGNCPGVAAVDLPDSLIELGDGAFSHCDSITALHIPAKLKYIGEESFMYMPALSKITADPANKDYYALNNCLVSFSGAIIRGSGNAVIAEGGSVKNIGYGAFSGSEGPVDVTVPRSVESIDGMAFANCPNLKTVSITTGTKSIGYGAFCGCPELVRIDYEGTKAQWADLGDRSSDKGAYFVHCSDGDLADPESFMAPVEGSDRFFTCGMFPGKTVIKNHYGKNVYYVVNETVFEKEYPSGLVMLFKGTAVKILDDGSVSVGGTSMPYVRFGHGDNEICGVFSEYLNCVYKYDAEPYLRGDLIVCEKSEGEGYYSGHVFADHPSTYCRRFFCGDYMVIYNIDAIGFMPAWQVLNAKGGSCTLPVEDEERWSVGKIEPDPESDDPCAVIVYFNEELVARKANLRDTRVLEGDEYDEYYCEPEREVYTVHTENVTPVFVNAPQSGSKNALLLIGAVGENGYIGVSELGLDDKLVAAYDDDCDINCDIVSPGDTITLYTEDGKTAATVRYTYFYFKEDIYPFFELMTDAALDENKVYFASTRDDLDIRVFALGADSGDIDLDGDGKSERITAGVTNELLESFEEVKDVGDDELYYFGTQWVKAENDKTSLQANSLITGYGEHVRLSILGACDFDGDGAKEFVTRFTGLYDRFAFWSFGGESLVSVIECG